MSVSCSGSNKSREFFRAFSCHRAIVPPDEHTVGRAPGRFRSSYPHHSYNNYVAKNTTSFTSLLPPVEPSCGQKTNFLPPDNSFLTHKRTSLPDSAKHREHHNRINSNYTVAPTPNSSQEYLSYTPNYLELDVPIEDYALHSTPTQIEDAFSTSQCSSSTQPHRQKRNQVPMADLLRKSKILMRIGRELDIVQNTLEWHQTRMKNSIEQTQNRSEDWVKGIQEELKALDVAESAVFSFVEGELEAAVESLQGYLNDLPPDRNPGLIEYFLASLLVIGWCWLGFDWQLAIHPLLDRGIDDEEPLSLYVKEKAMEQEGQRETES